MPPAGNVVLGVAIAAAGVVYLSSQTELYQRKRARALISVGISLGIVGTMGVLIPKGAPITRAVPYIVSAAIALGLGLAWFLGSVLMQKQTERDDRLERQ